ncbi:MFS transporter [Mesorhizobium sp. M1148]|jgi:MFS family permease|uniref:MFS transporter n=1 Tax=unclassified Mesorhizobium TaxID=325217 RepID=UPI0003CF0A27|nr:MULTISPECIES: MFS transporter [unclassified Mesorhizobium]ESW80291.1 MFS transporter [Mesorhizobium sp. LSJC285A00]ESW91042.1 MFS transporter [Mesorhizobium sp. LSJC269B00]ESX17042.1 MFS transporter [Mesorhizobium sp. LSJC264A00]ESX50864.1 MFS transporter [Mesorhizobium sp. LSHC426A00]ESX53991.1 MFS transporter [Mesorhizobium sp. LSHC424B00]
MTSHSHTPPDRRYAAFRHRSFLSYWAARFLTTFATMIVSVAVGWQIYDLTRDPFDLGIVGIVQFLPSLLLVLVTGVVADRFGRRLIMALATVVEAGCALVLLYFTLRGLVSPLPIFIVLAMFGLARAFYGPASSSLFANLVPPEDFGNAIAWNSSAWQTATIVGPVAGGLLYGVSAEAAYAVASVLMLVAGLLIFTIPKPAQQSATDKPTMETLFAGFRYIWSEKIVLGAISLDLFAVLLSGASALLPVYARDILELGPWGLGLLRSAPGIGAICVAVWLAGHPLRDSAGKIMLGFVAGFGAFTVLFGVSTITWLSILALAGLGATDMFSVYIRETLIQLWTPDEVRGRVNAVNQVFVGASNEVGEFRAGTMAALIGTVPAVVIGGVGAIAVAGLWAVLFPQLRRVRHLNSRN